MQSNETLNFLFGLVTGAFIAGWLVFLTIDKQPKNQTEANTHETPKDNIKPIPKKENTAIAYNSFSM
jgi:hypothetical protein